jgi:hypothetical protein
MKNRQEKEDHYNRAYTSTKKAKRRKFFNWVGIYTRSSA